MRFPFFAYTLLTLAFSLPVSATTFYVSDGSGSDANNGLSWATAKKTIQAGVDIAANGDTVLVTNGVYDSGFQNTPAGTNRVVVMMGIKVQSVNGPETTIIDGAASMRCVYLASNSATLVGFTLTNGFATSYGGGAYANFATISNCVISGNCVTNANAELWWVGGGGVYQGTLHNCIVKGNRAPSGGGLNYCDAYNSMISENIATFNGGGAFDCPRIRDCVIQNNTASEGGGGYYGSYENCTIVSNTALLSGGGVSQSGSKNSIIYYNTAPEAENHNNNVFAYTCSTPLPDGDGNISSPPRFSGGNYGLAPDSPCVNTGTNEDWMAGALDFAGNPRIYFGTVDMGALELSYSCPATVWPTSAVYGVAGGSGNLQITSAPDCSWFVQQSPAWISFGGSSNGTGAATVGYQVSSNSEYWRSGYIYINGGSCLVEQAGRPNKPVCLAPSTGSGVRTANVLLEWTNGGGATGYRIYLGTNSSLAESDLRAVQASGSLSVLGLPEGATYWRVDATNANGKTQGDIWSFTVRTSRVYVATNGAAIYPYSTWETAATSICEAISAAIDGDVVLASDGTYFESAPVSISKVITVMSLNGAATTIIDARMSNRCVVLERGVLDGFTLQNGRAVTGSNTQGGGVYILNGGRAERCVVRQCGAREGGGVYVANSGWLDSCTVQSNWASTSTNFASGGGFFLYL